jgi:hypothetical protein
MDKHKMNLTHKVVLLEGTRKVPLEDKSKLIDFTTDLAKQYSQAIFRSGNAAGSDELFAQGVESIDAKRMQQVLPYPRANIKRLHKDSPVMSLEDLNHDELQQLAELGAQATPSYQSLFKLYLKDIKKTRITIKAMYLLRDALKINGCTRLGFQPADCGYFFTDISNPTIGGTGHTIRMCRIKGIPVYTQDDWMK